MKVASLATLAKVTVGVLLLWAGPSAQAAEVQGLGLVSLKSSFDVLVPEFQQATGHRVTINYDGSSDLLKRFVAGERFDVALASSLFVDRLIKEGKVAAGTRADLARVAIGVGVKKGAPRPDISTADAFKRALLNAKSVSHASEGPSGVYLQTLLKRLGISEEMQPKLRPVPGGPFVVGPVAKGEVELAIITIPFIVLNPGADLVGPLPDELQEYVVYSAGVSPTARDSSAATALLRHISAPQAAPVYRSQGLDPIAR
jgi:molybdate transport system substrate-binding protein